MKPGGKHHRPGCDCPFCKRNQHSEPALDFSLLPDEGSTPIDPDSRQFLHEEYRNITTRGELNAAEGIGVARGMAWLSAQGEMSTDEFSSIWFQQELHRQMFGDVWTWAGRFRTREMSIGIAPEQIQPELYKLSGDLSFWVDSGMDPVEVCARFHHRQVQIHPFVNGNGRHSRESANHLAMMLGIEPMNDAQMLTWGSESFEVTDAREKYLAALRQADKGDYADLVKIAQA